MKGVLLFAFDNEAFDYCRMASWSARRIHRHLGVPVTLVTDKTIDDPIFDRVVTVENPTSGNRYFEDAQMSASWHNHTRPGALELSPYEQTLVLDVDYAVCSSDLRLLFKSTEDFLAHSRAWDVTNLTDYSGLNRFGRNRMPMSWATVMYFRKSTTASMIFDQMKSVKQHWTHFSHLYGITARSSFRNDYALSIALNLVQGHMPIGPSIPWALASVDPHHHITQIDDDSFRIEFIQEQRPRYTIVSGLDLHIMGKRDLGEIIDQS